MPGGKVLPGEEHVSCSSSLLSFQGKHSGLGFRAEQSHTMEETTSMIWEQKGKKKWSRPTWAAGVSSTVSTPFSSGFPARRRSRSSESDSRRGERCQDDYSCLAVNSQKLPHTSTCHLRESPREPRDNPTTSLNHGHGRLRLLSSASLNFNT